MFMRVQHRFYDNEDLDQVMPWSEKHLSQLRLTSRSLAIIVLKKQVIIVQSQMSMNKQKLSVVKPSKLPCCLYASYKWSTDISPRPVFDIFFNYLHQLIRFFHL